MKVKEITLELSYGNVAAKWWGPTNVQPIICLHGWQDNAGTFDTLIPLLPTYIGYLAIDFPGHGLSARFPNGMVYSTMDYVYLLHNIVRQFNWSKVSVLGHSLGAIVGFLYASAFPERCAMIIGLDEVKVHVADNRFISYYLSNFDDLVRADMRNVLAETEPPSFTYQEMCEKLRTFSPMLEIPTDYAPYLLERGIRPSKVDPGKFSFTRDGRLKIFGIAMFSHEMCLALADKIACPYLFIKCMKSVHVESNYFMYDTLEVLKKNPNFDLRGVDGGHHVHLIEPAKVSVTITEFINKYRSSDVFNNSKL